MFCKEDIVCRWEDSAPLSFDGVPDIAGIGVTLAFVITASLAYVLIMAVYLLVEDSVFSGGEPAIFDDIVRAPFRYLLKRLGLYPLRGLRFGTVAQKIAISLSDQQLITGAAILIVGFVQHCSITQYHFAVMKDLSWLAFTTIVSTARIAAEKYGQSTHMRLWRSLWVSCIFVSIVLSNLIVFNTAWLTQYGMSTQCVWNQLLHLDRSNSTSSAVVMVGAVSTSTTTLLSPTATSTAVHDFEAFNDTHPYSSASAYTTAVLLQMLMMDFMILWAFGSFIFTIHPSRWVQKAQRWLRFIGRLPVYADQYIGVRIQTINMTRGNLTHDRTSVLFRVKWSILLLARCLTLPLAVLAVTVSGLIGSQALENMRTFDFIVFSTIDLYWLRGQARNRGLQGNEDEWGFGQVLPVLLLALPVTMVFESLHTSEEEIQPARSSDCEQMTPAGRLHCEPQDSPLWFEESLPVFERARKFSTMTERVVQFEHLLVKNKFFQAWIVAVATSAFTLNILSAFIYGEFT